MKIIITIYFHKEPLNGGKESVTEEYESDIIPVAGDIIAHKIYGRLTVKERVLHINGIGSITEVGQHTVPCLMCYRSSALETVV